MDQLYWQPHGRLHALLQSYGASAKAPAAIQKQLEEQQDWLLNSLAFFRRPNEESRKLITGTHPSVTLKGRKFAIDKLLVPATLKLSSLLNLDELQTHILLKRWVKDAGVQVQGQILELELDEMVLVLEYYQQERLLLLKSIQYILLQGVTEPLFEKASATLVKSGLEDRLISVLRAIVEPHQATAPGIGAKPDTLSSNMAAVLKEFGGQQGNMAWLSGVHAKLREQQLAERFETTSNLLLLYEVVGVKCSSNRAYDLIHMLAGVALARPAGRLPVQQTGQAAFVLVAEQLSCTLVLSVLDLPAYISLASSQPPASTVSVDNLPLGTKLHDAHSHIRSWQASPAAAMLLLTWGGVAQLLEPYVSLGEGAAEEMQGRAQEAGLFQAAAASLETSLGMMSTAVAQLCRGVTLKALCVSATAFELGPTRQEPSSFESLVQLLKLVTADDAHVCTEVWDEGGELLAPIRAILLDACTLFPALPRPYLQLLRVCSQGARAASAAYTHLQTYPLLTCLHPANDSTLHRVSPDTVVLTVNTMWPQAPSVTTLALPAGIEGQVLPWPAALSNCLDPTQHVLVRWDVNSTIKSFGQLLVLGRAVHCLLHLRSCFNSSTPSDPQLVLELGDMLGLLARISREHPDSVSDLMSQSVDAAESRGGAPRKWSWLDVAARSLDLYSSLLTTVHAQSCGAPPSQLLDHTVDSIKLLHSISFFFPERVLAVVQALPLAAWQLPPSLFEATAQRNTVPLTALPSLNTDTRVLVGIMPQLRGFQQQCEAGQGSYPVTTALLELVTSFLERGYSKGFVSAFVLFSLDEMLPGHHWWQFKSAATRWDLSAALLKVLHLAITSGTHTEGCAGVLPLPTESIGASVPWSPSVTGASVPTHVNELSATVLQQLLFHGAALLFHVLPPSLHALDMLRGMDAQNPELLACEAALAALLQLLPVPLAAAEVYPQQELPLEVFMFHGVPTGQPPPATTLSAFIGYEQPELEGATHTSLSFLALRLVRSLQASASRLFKFQLTTHLPSIIMPKNGAAQSALIELFGADTARARPALFALAVEVLEAAVHEHPGLCDGMLAPPNANGTDTQKDQNEPAGGQKERTEGGGGGKVLPALSAPQSVLDGMLELMKCSKELRQESPQVMCALMRALCCFWQPQAFGQPPSALLRHSPELWSCLEDCITRGAPDLKSWQPTDDAWLQLSEAFAWQILLLEAFAHSRSQKGAPAESQGTPKELVSLLDRLRQASTLHKAALYYSDLGPSLQTVRLLWAALQALYLELGACAVSGGLGTPTIAAVPAIDGGVSAEDRTSMATEIKQELEEVVHALRSGAFSLNDVEDLHEHLLQQAKPAGAEPQPPESPAAPGSPSPASPISFQGSPASPISFQGSPLRSPGNPLPTKPSQRLHNMLLAHPLGSAILSRAVRVPILSHKPASYGPSYLIDPCSLPPLLGPILQHVAAADLVADCMAAVSEGASLAHARLASLQSATALLSVQASPENAKDRAQGPEGVKIAVSEATAVAVVSVSSLATWASSDLSKFGLASWSGLRALVHGVEQAALAATHMAMHALNHTRAIHQVTRTQRPPVDSQSPPCISAGANTGGMQTPPPRPRVLNARTAPPPPPPLQTQQDPARSKADQKGASAVSPWDCQQLATLLNTWLRLGPRAVGLITPHVLTHVADNLATSLLVAMQLYRDRPDAGVKAADHMGLQTVLLDLLPQMSKAVSSEALNTTLGTQVMLELVSHHLPAADWLPVLKAHLDLQAMLVQAASQVTASVASAADMRIGVSEQEGAWAGGQGRSLGMLQLALAVARVPEGARWMFECGVLECLHVMARQRLAPDGSGLAPVHVCIEPPTRLGEGTPTSPLTRPFTPDPLAPNPTAQPIPAPPTAAFATQFGSATQPGLSSQPGFSAPASLALVPVSGALVPVDQPTNYESAAAAAAGGGARLDTASAYAQPLRTWSAPHQQWCVLVSFASALLRSLGQNLDVESASIDFLAAIEPRLLLVCLPPAGDASQPLTLAGLFELERVLFLLYHFARYAGSWHFMLPGSLPKFRMVLTSFLAFAAKADSLKPVTLECPPQSATEKELAAQPSRVPCTKGWFRVCSLGSSNPGEVTPSTPGYPTTTKGGSLLALPPQGTPQPPTPGLFSRYRDGEETGQASTGNGSQYSVRLAESMHTCILHACLFLQATAPQVSEGEAGHLSGTWPRSRDLVSLEEQTLEVLYSIRGGDEACSLEPRHTRTCMTLLKTLHLLCDFVDVVGCPANRRVWHGELREHLGAIENALVRQEPLPPLVTLFSSSVSGMSHSSSLAVPTQSGTLSLSMSLGTLG